MAKQTLPSDAKIILFGSQARGDAHADSDWDVLLLLNKERIEWSDYDNYAYPFRDFGWSVNESINPILYTFRGWAEASHTPFYKNVMNEGQVL